MGTLSGSKPNIFHGSYSTTSEDYSDSNMTDFRKNDYYNFHTGRINAVLIS